MRKLSITQTSNDVVEVNLSPLIDMMFLLLIFFIVTTAFVEEAGIEIEKPRAASTRPQPQQSLMLAVDAEGRVYYGNREIGLSGIKNLVSGLSRNEDKKPVILMADRHCPSGALVDVIDECKQSGAGSVSLATRKEEN